MLSLILIAWESAFWKIFLAEMWLFLTVLQDLKTLNNQAFENIEGKGENAG